MIAKIEIPEARSMTAGERKAFKASGTHPAFCDIKKPDGEYRNSIEVQEAMTDWIIDHIYGGASDDCSYGDLCKLADETYRLTYGIKLEEQEKN